MAKIGHVATFFHDQPRLFTDFSPICVVKFDFAFMWIQDSCGGYRFISLRVDLRVRPASRRDGETHLAHLEYDHFPPSTVPFRSVPKLLVSNTYNSLHLMGAYLLQKATDLAYSLRSMLTPEPPSSAPSVFRIIVIGCMGSS